MWQEKAAAAAAAATVVVFREGRLVLFIHSNRSTPAAIRLHKRFFDVDPQESPHNTDNGVECVLRSQGQ